MKSTTKAVLYMRYSSANQTEQSIEGQRHICEKYATANGIEIISEYVDRARTGTSDKRPQFQRMIADSDKQIFNAVLVYKLDRFARNRYDSAMYKRHLKLNGVRVISATEALSDGPEGIVLEALLEGMDEYYSAELARKMRRGKEESIKKGKFINARTPYGYQKQDHRLAADPATAPEVVKMFELYASGKCISEIISEISRPGGREWKICAVSRILRNPIYKGEYKYPGMDVQPCPALVSVELYEAVQKRLDEYATSHRRGKTKFTYHFSGKLYCGHCGGRMSGSSANGRYFYYRCRKDKINLNADELHKKIFAALREHLTPDKIDELARAAYEEYQTIPANGGIDDLRAELAGVQQKIKNAVEAILNGVELTQLTDKLNGLQARETELKRQILAVEQSPGRLTLEQFKKILTDISHSTPEEIISIFADAVVVNGDAAEIYLNFADDCISADLFKVSDICKSDTLNKFRLLVKIA